MLRRQQRAWLSKTRMTTPNVSTRRPTAAWDMQKFWYNVTKAGEVKYGNFVQIERNGNGQNRER